MKRSSEIQNTIKYYNEKGEVAVLVSPGFGAGWYSWNKDRPELLFDKDIVAAVLEDDRYKAEKVAVEKYGKSIFTGGVDQLKIEWLEPSTLFRIDEYDGSELLITYTNDVWFKA